MNTPKLFNTLLSQPGFAVWLQASTHLIARRQAGRRCSSL